MLLKVAIKCYCVKNKGGIIYEKIVPRGACLLLALCLSLSAVGCQKSNENNKIKEGQSISSEEEGMSINANGKNETFKPSGFESIPRTRFVRIFSRFQRVSISSFRPAVKPKPFDR
ncbi:hypothetical protein QQ504_15220, partial [Enterococcus faecium]|nr:hypothetical protein [Enterococcus faecium]